MDRAMPRQWSSPVHVPSPAIPTMAYGILAYFAHRITNAISEGINNKIKVIKRRSYGFHDMDYFFLKILNATGALPSLASLQSHF